MSVQRSYLERHMHTHLQSNANDAPSFLDMGSDDGSQNMSIEEMKLMPNSTEAVVERALFDAVCAFTSGIRIADGAESAGRKGRKREGLKGKFRVTQDSMSGSVDIVFDEDSDVAQADSAELMNAMQIPIFLKFIQTRKEDKILILFTEKVASILNYVRQTNADMAEQVAEARMQSAKGKSNALNITARVEKMRAKLIYERLAKQKSMLKLIREQIRWSDTCMVLDQVKSRASAELEYQASQYSLTKRDEEMKILLKDVLSCAESAINASSSSAPKDCPTGSLEIRVPESQVDDETLHGIFALLTGAILDKPAGEESNDLATSTKSMIPSQSSNFTPYLDRIVLLNLRDNSLTDLSCKLLSPLLEKSSTLRMVDLRGNKLTESGATVILDAININPSVMYVSQKQGGFMLEGHREINTKEGDHIKNASVPKLPSLRVDLRLNVSTSEDAEEMLIAIEPAKGTFVPGKALAKPDKLLTYNSSAYREEEGNLYALTTVTPQGLMTADKLNMNQAAKRPQSASAKFGNTSDSSRNGNTFNFGDSDDAFANTLRSTSHNNFRSDISSPTNIFGPTVSSTDSSPRGEVVLSKTTGSLLDKHIRILREQHAEISSDSKVKAVDHSKYEKMNQKYNKAKTISSPWNNRSPKKSTTADKRHLRPYSAGAIRPNSGTSTGLKAIKKPKSPAEAMFVDKEKASSVLKSGPVIKERVIPSGFYQSASVVRDSSPSFRKSSAFTLLDNLEKRRGEDGGLF